MVVQETFMCMVMAEHGQYNGNYSTRANNHGFILDSNTEVYCECSYNYITRADDYGAIFYHARENVQRRHWVFLNHEGRAISTHLCNTKSTL